MKNWGDAKMFIFEDICVYSLLLIMSITADFWINFLDSVNLITLNAIHPYELGLGQVLLIAGSLIQLVRSWYKWRYYE